MIERDAQSDATLLIRDGRYPRERLGCGFRPKQIEHPVARQAVTGRPEQQQAECGSRLDESRSGSSRSPTSISIRPRSRARIGGEERIGSSVARRPIDERDETTSVTPSPS
jgi:hypothetical protein